MFKKIIAYVQDIYRADSPASFSRYATTVCVLSSIVMLAYLVGKNHDLPDSTKIFALGAWMTAPYAVNKAASCFDKPPAQP